MFYSENDLKEMGFKYLGKNVLLSDKTSIYNPRNIEIGDNTRIDDFCVLSAGKGGIKIGSHVHIAVYCSLIGDAQIILDDFSGISSKTAIYSSTDDYSGICLTNPTVSKDFTNVISGLVHLKKHVIVGAGTIILPNVTLEEGVAVGALSLVNKSFPEYKIVVGCPAKIIKDRRQDIKNLEKEFMKMKI